MRWCCPARGSASTPSKRRQRQRPGQTACGSFSWRCLRWWMKAGRIPRSAVCAASDAGQYSDVGVSFSDTVGATRPMSDTQQLVDVLKQLLKARQLTYADLALQLGLSHASVKRLFSAQTFTLARLAQVCRVLEIDFFDLARLARGRTDSTREMSERQ